MFRIVWWLSMLSVAACAGKLENKNAFLEAGVPDGGSDNDASACALGNIQTELVDAKCAAAAGCHSDQTPAQGLVLKNVDVNGASLAARLVDVESEVCAGKKFIDSASASDSYVLEKLEASPACGVVMPLGQTLTEEEIACMQEWAQALAGAQ